MKHDGAGPTTGGYCTASVGNFPTPRGGFSAFERAGPHVTCFGAKPSLGDEVSEGVYPTMGELLPGSG